LPKICAVCGRELSEEDIRIIERRRILTPSRRIRYLCSECRKKEYQRYIKELERLTRG
jgi:hypothetical protein